MSPEGHLNGFKKGPPKSHFWVPKMVFPRFATSGLCRGSTGSQVAVAIVIAKTLIAQIGCDI